MARILFVFPCAGSTDPLKPLSTREDRHEGLSILAACLERKGHKTNLVVLSRTHPQESLSLLDKEVRDFQPDILAYTAVSTLFPFATTAALAIRQLHPSIFQILGGPHASLDSTVGASGAYDAICVGEGELALEELAAQIDAGQKPFNIRNLLFRPFDSNRAHNVPREFLHDLSVLPISNHQMWERWIRRTPDSRASVVVSRGCPFLCTYCSNHALRRLATGQYVRFRTVDSIIQEMDAVLSLDEPPDTIYLETETFSINTNWAMTLCARLQSWNASRPTPVGFGVNYRVTDNADPGPLFQAMAHANFKYVQIGLESGSARIRRGVLNRNYSNRHFLRTVQEARRSGLRVHVYNLIGIPGETLRDHLRTIALNRACQPDRVLTSIFYPYPGTRLYDLCRKMNLLPPTSLLGVERSVAPFGQPGFSRRQVQLAYAFFDYHVFHGKRSFSTLQLARRYFTAHMRLIPWIYYAYRRITNRT